MEGSFMLSDTLTKEKLEQMEPGVFAQGTVSDNAVGVNMAGSGELLRWVAVRGAGPDWAIYIHWATSAWEYVASNGDKIYNKENVKKLIDCDGEALARYRD